METNPSTTRDRDDFLSCEAVLLARTYAWELLHKLFGGEPTGELLSIVGSEETINVFDELAEHNLTLTNLRDFIARVGEKSVDAAFAEAVRDEYARFFEGPAEPPAFPWEGPYITHEPTIFQPSTLAVRQAYRDAGLQVRRYQRVPDDHIALMAAFMAELGHRTLAALKTGNKAATQSLLTQQYNFSRDHMANWLPEYAELSLRVKKATLYPQFIQGARALAEADNTFLPEAFVWLDELDNERLSAAAADVVADENPFAPVEAALEHITTLTLPGLEDNELAAIA